MGANQEATYKAKETGVAPPASRVVRIDLTTGAFIDVGAKLSAERTPGRPFKGPDVCGDAAGYRPSLDPVREEGTAGPPAK